MDMNLVIVSGTLAAPAEYRQFESGASLLRMLVTARTDSPSKRVDVLPVTLWEPPADHPAINAPVGSRVWVTGSVQRRFWAGADGRRSQLELVASDVRVLAEAEQIKVGEVSV